MIDRIQQLRQQSESAELCRAALKAAKDRQPEAGVIWSWIEAERTRCECNAELQKELYLDTTEQAA